MSLAKTAIHGAYFTSLALASRQIISFLTIIFIARILSPTDFGVAAMVMVVVGLAQVIGDVGVSAGLVRTQKSSSIAYSTCFWIGMAIGVGLTAGLVLAAPIAARFYGEADITPLLRVAAIGLLVNCCMPVPLAILQQRLDYKQIALSQALGSLAGAITAIACATSGLGVWSLVLQPIVGNVVSVSLMMGKARWSPSWEFSYDAVRDVMRDGLNLLGSSISQYALNNFDTMIIGGALSSRSLGVYSMARTVLNAPDYLITSVVSRVIFPLLSKIQGDAPKIRETILTASSRTGLLSFPLYLGLLVVADDFVMLAFGKHWMDMVPLLQIMIIPAMIQSIGHIAPPILVALGASRTSLHLSVGSAIFFFIVLLASINFGLTAVAYGYAFANAVIGILSILLVLRQASIPLQTFTRSMAMPLLLSVVMASAVFLLKQLVDTPPITRLALIIGTGMFFYAALVFIFQKRACQQIINAFARKR